MATEMLHFECGTCSAKFKKIDHLNRHLLSHGNVRTYECSFCSSSFHRRDALLRHWRTCGERLKSGLPMPSLPAGKRGRKQNACARCAQLKKKCSGTLPCDICAKQGHDCTYARSTTKPSTASDPSSTNTQASANIDAEVPRHNDECPPILMSGSPTFWLEISDVQGLHPPDSLPPIDAFFSPVTRPSMGPPNSTLAPHNCTHTPPFYGYSTADLMWNAINTAAVPPMLPPRPQFLRSRLRFVVRFTATHGIANLFSCGNPTSRRQIMSPLSGNRVASSMAVPDFATVSGIELATAWQGLDGSDSGQGRFVTTNRVDICGIAISADHCQQVWLHPLTAKSHEIVRRLGESHCARTRNPLSWTEARQRSCARFFSPENLDKYMNSFWYFWSPNWPVLHRPTFVATRRSPHLIAAMALMGACLTSEKSDHDQAIGLLEDMEEWVFTDIHFCYTPIPQTGDAFELTQVHSRVDMAHASFITLLMLMWEGTSERQATRARRIHFSEIISVGRTLYPFAWRSGTTHKSIITTTRYDAWKLFALREECIRSILYIFLLDCAFIIYNNTAPRMFTDELQYGLVCPDSCFQASDPDIWFKSMQEWLLRQPLGHITVAELIDISLKEDLRAEEWQVLEQASLLNLFAIASAFHNLIFLHRNGSESHMKSLRVSRGLRNWVRVWGDRDPVPTENDDPQPDLRKPGFIRYVREYWSLAVIFHNQDEYKRKLNLQLLEDQGTRKTAGLLVETDSSDMGPIHELVVRLQDIDLSEALM